MTDDRLTALEREVRSTDPSDPGLALRLDRLERDFAALVRQLHGLVTGIKWIVGGGGLGFAATLLFLYKLVQAMDAGALP